MEIMHDIIVVLAIAAVVLYFCLRLKLPTIVAFLVAGMLAGPYGLALIKADAVGPLAEIGVLLLLFTIGIEFSIEKMITSRRFIFLGGTVQMVFTIFAFFIFSMVFGYDWNQALFIGFLFSLSSTAIVLQLFQETNQIESLHGRVSLSILIFQDIAIVPLMLVVPWIASSPNHPFRMQDVFNLLAGIFMVAVVIIASRKFVPRLIHNIVHTRNRELFLLFIIVICFLMASITNSIGLSYALGAFLAGLIISESEFSLEAMSNILPLKKIFTSIFFISVGMLLNLNFFIHQPFQILGITMAVITLKVVVVLLVGIFLKLPARSVVITALALCQVGEFAFVLAGQGKAYKLLNDNLSQVFLAVSVISMGVSPFIIQYAPRIAARFTRVPKVTDTDDSPKEPKKVLNDHLVIVGFGTNGRNVARAAKVAEIPCAIIDFNPETYRKEKKGRENFIYGDATNEEVLHKANIDTARIAVVATHDPVATEMIVSAIRSASPKVRLIVRTRFMNDVEVLRKLGADEVIPEEFETSIEIFTRVMKYYLVPDTDIENVVHEVRNENYEMLRRLSDSHSTSQMPFLSVMDIARLKITENSKWIGRSIEEIMLRKKFDVTAIAILRQGEYIHNPPASTVIIAEDEMLVIGLPDSIKKLSPFVKVVA